MSWGIIDNRQIRILAETHKELSLAIELAMSGRKAEAYLEHNEGIVLMWHNNPSDCGHPLMCPGSSASVTEMLIEWLEQNRDNERGRIDMDGSLGHGFLLETNTWGNALDAESESDWAYGMFFLRPHATWIGK